jgi:hypothetical protein
MCLDCGLPVLAPQASLPSGHHTMTESVKYVLEEGEQHIKSYDVKFIFSKGTFMSTLVKCFMSCPPLNLHINCQTATLGENQTHHCYDKQKEMTI